MTTQLTSIYLLSNDQDINWGLTVSTVGYQHIAPGEAYPPKGHPQAYSFQAVGFKGLNIDSRVSNGFFLPREPIFHVGLSEDIVRLYRNAIAIASEQSIGFQQMLGGVANMLQGYAFALNRHNTFEDQQAAEAIHKAKIIMTEKFGQKIGPTDVADAINMGYSKFINMGYSKFRRLFKEYTGYAPLQYLQELRLQRSKQLLVGTELTLTEIADRVGYDNADYFSVAFKKKNHITPANFRKKR